MKGWRPRKNLESQLNAHLSTRFDHFVAFAGKSRAVSEASPVSWPSLSVPLGRGSHDQAALTLWLGNRITEEFCDCNHDALRGYQRMLRECNQLSYWSCFMITADMLQGPLLEHLRVNQLEEVTGCCWRPISAPSCRSLVGLSNSILCEAGRGDERGNAASFQALSHSLKDDAFFDARR